MNATVRRMAVVVVATGALSSLSSVASANGLQLPPGWETPWWFPGGPGHEYENWSQPGPTLCYFQVTNKTAWNVAFQGSPNVIGQFVAFRNYPQLSVGWDKRTTPVCIGFDFDNRTTTLAGHGR